MSKWELFERCSDLMADYKEIFGKNVPGYLLFNPMEEICEMVEKAITEGKELEEWEH